MKNTMKITKQELLKSSLTWIRDKYFVELSYNVIDGQELYIIWFMTNEYLYDKLSFAVEKAKELITKYNLEKKK